MCYRAVSLAHANFARAAGIIPREHFEPSADSRAIQAIEQRFHGRKLDERLADHQVVTLGRERQKSQTERLRGRSGRDAAIRFPEADGERGGEMSVRDAVVTQDVLRRDARALQFMIQKIAAAGAKFAIDDAHGVL